MLPAAHWGNVHLRTFQYLQQGLLHTFTRHITGYRRIGNFTGRLVYLVYVDDAALGLFDVIVGSLQQRYEYVLYVLSYVPGFGDGSRVCNREWHIHDPRQRARGVSLPAT